MPTNPTTVADRRAARSAALVATARRDTVAPVVEVATLATSFGLSSAELVALRAKSRLRFSARIRRVLGDTDLV